MCAAQTTVQDIIRRQVQWKGVQEALNESYLDQAVLHFLRAVTSLQMLAHAADCMMLFTVLDDEYR